MEYIGITKNEIKELTETLLFDFLKHINTKGMTCIDIDGLASFFGLTIVYENIAEADRNKIAFFSDGKKPLCVYRNGKAQMICFPSKTIVIDNYLRQISMSGKRRYTIAHEIGHYILEHYGYAPVEARYYNEYEATSDYCYRELKQLMNFNETQANEIGSYFLMPEFLVRDYVREFFKDDKIPIYGEYLIKPETKRNIKLIANKLGVSFGALMIQLKKFDMILHLPANAFCEEGVL